MGRLCYRKILVDKKIVKRNIILNFICILIILVVYSNLPFRFSTLYHNYVSLDDIRFDLFLTDNTHLRGENYCKIPLPFPNEGNDFKGYLYKHVYLRDKNISLLENATARYGVKNGGEWRPKSCVPIFKVAIVVPFRERDFHLSIFLSYVTPFLQKQNIHYRIFIIEQTRKLLFNRGKLLNIGFEMVNKLWETDCFIFHDVDLLPENLNNVYACSKLPRHASSSVNTLRYNLPYRNMFGGVTAVRKSHFTLINGYSNLYFGWGAEDDDIYKRFTTKNIEIVRWDPKVARYSMIFHRKESSNPAREKLLNSATTRSNEDGLNSLKFEVLRVKLLPLFTKILVNL